MGVDIQKQAMDYALAKDLSDTLCQGYPGYPWMVHVDSRAGMIDIVNLKVQSRLARQHGYRLHLKGPATASELKKSVLMAGGEILERARISREKNSKQEITKIDGVPDNHIIKVCNG